jgi:hypothetical protein
MSSVVALILIVAGNVTFGRLQIQSDVPCPTAADVSASLHRLLGAEPSTPSTVSVSLGETSLEVRLTDGNGATLSERMWPRSTDCAADAQAIAVMAAAWAEDLPPVREALVAPPPSAVVATVPARPPRDATASRFTLRLGSGVASPISTGQSSETLIWPVPTLQLDFALRGAGAVTRFGTIARFGSLGLFADLPRWRGWLDTSWHRYTLEPMGGVAVSRGELSYAAGAGLSVGVLGSNMSGYPYGTFFDAGVIAELRVGYTLDVGHGEWGLWMSLRGRAAFERAAYEEWGPAGPMSPYEAALLVGGDFSWRR